MSKVLTAVVALVVGVVIGAAVVTAQPKLGGVTIEDEVFLADVSVGGDLTVGGAVTGDFETVAVSTATTLTAAQSGSVFVFSSGVTVTLPAVTNAGWNARFAVGTAFASSNAVIDSAEGDNIDGTLIVAGAVVDCRGEDQLDFVNDGEQLGDYVEIYSDGSKWLIADSGALTTAKLTCTDPS
jgi:hypothetical protein